MGEEVDHFSLHVPSPLADCSPLVVLLGWAGASDKALFKYAELVAELGLPSVRSVLPTSALFAPLGSPRRQWALGLLEYLAALPLALGSRPLVLYSFSNGGGFVVEELQLMTEAGDPRAAFLKERVAGFVFDSAPAYMHWHMGRRVLEAETPPGLTRTLRVAAFTAVALVGKAINPRRPERYWETMARLDWGKPFLFLYSQDDHLCDAAKLDELIQEKRSRGQDVRSHKWLESGHVSHYRLHAVQYRQLLFDFLQPLLPAERDPGFLRSKL